MKKLMFGFAMAAAIVACADVESSNVVGYQEVAVPAGYCMRTPTFRAMSGDYKISDIIVNGAAGAGNENAQIINADGSWSETVYYYLTEDETFVPTGWYKDSSGEDPVTDEDVLAEGEAIFFAADSDCSFTFAGQVASTKPTFTAPAGYCQFGNPTPVDVKISDIAVEGAVGAGNDNAQLVNADGSWSDTVYYYLTEDEAFVPTGWYKDSSGEDPVTDTDVLAAGDAVFFAADAECTLTFPKPL